MIERAARRLACRSKSGVLAAVAPSETSPNKVLPVFFSTRLESLLRQWGDPSPWTTVQSFHFKCMKNHKLAERMPAKKRRSVRQPLGSPVTAENVYAWSRDRLIAQYGQLREIIGKEFPSLVSKLPVLDMSSLNNNSDWAEECATRVRMIYAALLSGLNGADSLRSAIQAFRGMFLNNPELMHAKTSVVIKKLHIARALGLKALGELRKSGEYHGHQRPNKRTR